MRKILFLCIFPFCTSIFAQNNKGNLTFIYIDHESSTPVNKICDRIKDIRDDALEMDDALIIYLANGDKPLISLTNVPDEDNEYSGDEKFTEIIGQLQEMNSHDVNASKDVRTIIELLNRCKVSSSDESLNWESLTMDFYVGPSFWALGNNERLISKLYFVMEIPKIQKQGEVNFNIYKGRDVKIDSADGYLFGPKNVEGINNIRILEI